MPPSPPLFSITSLPSVTSSILWAGETSDRDTTPGYGLPFPGAPAGDQPADPVGPLGFRYQLDKRDVLLAPGRATVLSQTDDGHAAFAGGNSSSAPTTSRFRDFNPHTPLTRCLRFRPRVAATPARLATGLLAQLWPGWTFTSKLT